MVLEVAILEVRQGQSKAFEAAFLEAQQIISSQPGYQRHELRRWRELLHPFYDPFPQVEHYVAVPGASGAAR